MSETTLQQTSPLPVPEGATTAEIGPVTVVWTYGDIDAEYESIRGSAAKFDFSGAGIVEVTGDDAYDVLQAALARDLEFVTPEQSLISALLDEQGATVSIVTVFHVDEGFRLETSLGTGPAVVAHLSALVEAAGSSADVALKNDETTIILVEGPQAATVLETLVDPELGALPLSGTMPVEFAGTEITVSRTGFTGEYGYKLFVPADAAVAAWDALSSIAPAGVAALEITMFEVRQPLPHRETVEGASALETGYAWLVDITKEEFHGRDAIIDAFESGIRARTVGFVAPSVTEPLPLGAEISIDGVVVGAVAHSVFSPGRKEVIGLAQLEPDLVSPHLNMSVGDVEILTIPAPYVVPASWKNR